MTEKEKSSGDALLAGGVKPSLDYGAGAGGVPSGSLVGRDGGLLEPMGGLPVPDQVD